MSNNLASMQVIIFGLGLMGGSLAYALRNKCRKLTAVDTDISTRNFARKNNVVHEILNYPPDPNTQADLVILAAPVITNIQIISSLPNLISASAVVLDLGSTKTDTLMAMSKLPTRFDPIGGHPMCGKEFNSIHFADPDIYVDATFALSPLERTSKKAREIAIEIVEVVGSKPLWIDPETHDRWVAHTSHLPYLLSNVLAASTPDEASPLIGPGYRSMSRLAGTNPGMMVDIFQTNRDNVIYAIEKYQQELEKLSLTLQHQERNSILDLLNYGRIKYQRFQTRD